jgi:hypothetical protein
MKGIKNDLDLDFIGGGRPLTKEDTKAISDFIRNHKDKQKENLEALNEEQQHKRNPRRNQRSSY